MSNGFIKLDGWIESFHMVWWMDWVKFINYFFYFMNELDGYVFKGLYCHPHLTSTTLKGIELTLVNSAPIYSLTSTLRRGFYIFGETLQSSRLVFSLQVQSKLAWNQVEGEVWDIGRRRMWSIRGIDRGHTRGPPSLNISPSHRSVFSRRIHWPFLSKLEFSRYSHSLLCFGDRRNPSTTTHLQQL